MSTYYLLQDDADGDYSLMHLDKGRPASKYGAVHFSTMKKVFKLAKRIAKDKPVRYYAASGITEFSTIAAFIQWINDEYEISFRLIATLPDISQLTATNYPELAI